MDYYNISPGVSGTVTLEDLRLSRSATSGQGQLSQTQFIDAITEIIESSKLKWNVGNIFYKNNTGRNPGIEILDISRETAERQEEYAPKLVNQLELQHPSLLLFKRLTGIIELPTFSDEAQTGNIAFSISQQGFELAVGNNVHICDNMCILNTSHRVASFGHQKKDPVEMLVELKSWINNYKNIYVYNVALIQKMKEVIIGLDMANKIFGDLHRMSIMNSKTKLRALRPEKNVNLGTTLVSKGQAKFLDEIFLKQRKQSSLWDIYNDITFNMKPDQMDTIGMISENANLSQYLLSTIN